MKTTIEISDNLLSQAKQLAHEQKVTLRSLVEEGLAQALKERSQRTAKPIQPVVFGGNDIRPEFKDRPWEAIREAHTKGMAHDRGGYQRKRHPDRRDLPRKRRSETLDRRPRFLVVWKLEDAESVNIRMS